MHYSCGHTLSSSGGGGCGGGGGAVGATPPGPRPSLSAAGGDVS